MSQYKELATFPVPTTLDELNRQKRKLASLIKQCKREIAKDERALRKLDKLRPPPSEFPFREASESELKKYIAIAEHLSLRPIDFDLSAFRLTSLRRNFRFFELYYSNTKVGRIKFTLTGVVVTPYFGNELASSKAMEHSSMGQAMVFFIEKYLLETIFGQND